MDYAAQLGVFICIFAILGTSLDLVMGRGGMFSIAHAAYYGVGAYTAALFELRLGLPFLVSFALAMLFAGALGAITSLPALRLSGDYLIVASIATQIVCLSLFVNLDSVTNGPAGLQAIPIPSVFGISLDSSESYLGLALFCLLLVLAFQALLMKRPWGRLLRGSRDDPIAVGAVGKNVSIVKVSAFILSAAIAGLAGALYADFITFISPDSFNLNQSVMILAIVIAGGINSLWGSVLGAALVVLLPEGLRLLPIGYSAEASVELFAYGALLVLFVMFEPTGLVGLARRGWRLIPRSWLGAAADTEAASPSPRAPVPIDTVRSAAPAAAVAARTPVIEFRGVGKSFGGIRALDDVSLQIDAGTVTGILGPNGAGKTTILDVVTGFVVPDTGEVLIRGRRSRRQAPYRIARNGVVRVFQEARVFPEMTLRENVVLGYPEQPRERLRNLFNLAPRISALEKRQWREAAELLSRVGLSAKADQPAGALSYGQQKLVTLVRALAADPSIVLLDEPSVGLALPMIDTMCVFVEGLVADGRTVVIVEHNLDVMRRLAGRLVFMHEGQVGAVGSIDEVLGDVELGRVYSGVGQ